MSALIRGHPLAAYFLITYALSWAIAVPLAARALGWLPVPLPFAAHYLIPFGPMLAALIVTRIADGQEGLARLYGSLLHRRVGSVWILFAVFGPVLAFLAGMLVAPQFGAATPDLRDLGAVNFMPYLGLGAWLLWFLTFGIGEETGWRGSHFRGCRRTGLPWRPHCSSPSLGQSGTCRRSSTWAICVI